MHAKPVKSNMKNKNTAKAQTCEVIEETCWENTEQNRTTSTQQSINFLAEKLESTEEKESREHGELGKQRSIVKIEGSTPKGRAFPNTTTHHIDRDQIYLFILQKVKER